MDDQVSGARLGAAGVLERTGEAGPAIDLDQKIRQVQLGQACYDLIAQVLGAGRRIFASHRADDQVVTDAPDVFVLRKAAIETSQDRLQFGLPLAQARFSILRCTSQSASVCLPGWPLFARDQIRFGVCVSTTAIYPDVTCS